MDAYIIGLFLITLLLCAFTIMRDIALYEACVHLGKNRLASQQLKNREEPAFIPFVLDDNTDIPVMAEELAHKNFVNITDLHSLSSGKDEVYEVTACGSYADFIRFLNDMDCLMPPVFVEITHLESGRDENRAAGIMSIDIHSCKAKRENKSNNE